MANLADSAVKLSALTSIYSAVGLTTGALAALVVPAIHDLDPWTAFAFGFFIPIGPLYLYASSEYAMTRKLTALKTWHENGLVDRDQYDRLLHRLTGWYGDRVFPASERRHPQLAPGAEEASRLGELAKGVFKVGRDK
ncbi:MAG: hypothetical protein RIC55_09415 [Pirellulaceae bacterium]